MSIYVLNKAKSIALCVGIMIVSNHSQASAKSLNEETNGTILGQQSHVHIMPIENVQNSLPNRSALPRTRPQETQNTIGRLARGTFSAAIYSAHNMYYLLNKSIAKYEIIKTAAISVCEYLGKKLLENNEIQLNKKKEEEANIIDKKTKNKDDILSFTKDGFFALNGEGIHFYLTFKVEAYVEYSDLLRHLDNFGESIIYFYKTYPVISSVSSYCLYNSFLSFYKKKT
jgi:hypothetical protein